MNEKIAPHSLWISRGAFLAFAGVLLGAFGAHSLKQKISAEHLAVFQTGVFYQMIHSLALILIGIWSNITHKPDRIGWFFAVGILLFSGSLYALSISGITILGMITPLGGVAFLLGWLGWGISAK